jgi:hypothetical protein
MSLTAPVINRQPVGLLDFFGLKNGGQYPQQLGTTLAPTIDLLRLYESDVEEFISDGIARAAGGAIGDFDFGAVTNFPGIVPQNELWHILEYSIQLAVPANVTMWTFACTAQIQRISPTVFGTGRGSMLVGEPVAAPVANAANPANIVRARAATDFWLPANGILGGVTMWLDPVATAVPAFHNVRFVRYRRS